MKVLIVLQFYIEGSGSGVYSSNIARELLSAGHEVRMIVAENVADLEAHARSYILPTRSILFDSEGKGRGDLNFNVPYFTTHPRSATTFLELPDNDLSCYVDVLGNVLQDEIVKFSPDIVHCQHASIFAYHLSKLRVPYVITLHGTDIMGFQNDTRIRDMVMKGVNGAYRLVSISQHVSEEAKALFKVADEHIVLIQNGYDENVFFARNVAREQILEKLRVQQTQPLLGDSEQHVVSFVGKLAPFKGIDVLIRAAAIYEKELPNTITLITGQGQLHAELEELVKAVGAKGVHFLGHRNQNEVAEIYTIADVSTVPSRHEPFGLVALEAMACGTPVVATAGGGLVDFVDERVGALVAIDDEKALAHAIISELKSNSKLTKGAIAAKYAREKFSGWKLTVENLSSLFNSAIEESSF